MRTEDLFFHTIKTVNKHFGYVPVKGEIRYDNGVYILNFQIKDFILDFISDRGLLEMVLWKEGKAISSILKFKEVIFNKTTAPENIDFIVDILYQHRDEIFCND